MTQEGLVLLTIGVTTAASAGLKLLLKIRHNVLPVDDHMLVPVLSLVGVVEGDAMQYLMDDGAGLGAHALRCQGDLSIGATMAIRLPVGVTQPSHVISQDVHQWKLISNLMRNKSQACVLTNHMSI